MKAHIGQRIAEIRRGRGYTQEQLSEMAMISRITLARYETGVIEPGVFAICRLADALGTTTDELLCRAAKLPPFVPVVRSSVPILQEAAHGYDPENVEGYAELPDGTAADFALKCKDDSMNPTLLQGDLVLIRQQSDIQPGQIAAVSVDGISCLNRIYKYDSGNMILVSDNPEHQPQIITGGEAVCIFGQAIGFLRIW